MTLLNRRATLVGLSTLGLVSGLPAFAATTHEVSIKAMKFAADDLSIKVGDAVTFINLDSAPHTATADDGSFDTGKLKKGDSNTVQFAVAGDFTYYCNIHRNMKGVVRVA